MCGIFGIYGHPEASNITYLGLHALQHRGQESAGIVSADGGALHARREMGLVQDVFGARELEALAGSSAIGHVRYSTAGVSQAKNAQPLTMQYAGGKVAVAHNGNLVNAQTLRARLEAEGAIFAGDSDTEVIVHLIARSRARKLEDQIVEALRQCVGAYSLIFETPTEVIGVRDAYGFRPLVLGRLREAYVLASETTALDLVEAEFVREIEPGEMVVIDGNGLRSSKPFETVRPAPLRLRVRLLRQARLGALRKQRLRDAQGARAAAGPGAAGPLGGSGHRRAGLGRARRHRLQPGLGHPLRRRSHPQPLRRPHLHRAAAVHPPLRGEAEALRGPRGAPGQEGGRGG